MLDKEEHLHRLVLPRGKKRDCRELLVRGFAERRGELLPRAPDKVLPRGEWKTCVAEMR